MRRVLRHASGSRYDQNQFSNLPPGGDLAAGLSEIYQMQELFRDNLEKVGLSSTDWFDPAAHEAAVRKLYMAMVELQYDERQLLLPLYRKYLPLITAAMGHR